MTAKTKVYSNQRYYKIVCSIYKYIQTIFKLSCDIVHNQIFRLNYLRKHFYLFLLTNKTELNILTSPV